MPDWTRPFIHRERWRRVRATDGVELGDVPGILAGGTLTYDLNAQIHRTASIECAGMLDLGPDWLRLYIDFEFLGGEAHTACAGTFLVSQSDGTYTTSGTSAPASLFGLAQVLADDQFEGTHTVARGADPVAAAASIARGCALEVRAEGCSVRLGAARTYGLSDSEGDGTKLDIANDLLSAGGFASVDNDPYGRIVMARYVEPARRPVAAEWREGPRARFLADVTVTQDNFAVPNCVKCVYSTANKTVTGYAKNTDPGSEWSVPRKGREVWKRYTYSEESTAAKATARAKELLRSECVPTRKVRISHVWDGTDIGDVVVAAWSRAGIDEAMTIQKMVVDLGDPALMVETELRGFAA